MFIDLDVEDIIIKAIENYLAGGGEFVTYDEHEKVLDRVRELEDQMKDMNFWKADRNHSHKEGDRKDYSWLLD